MPQVKFLPTEITVDAKMGDSILDIALAHGVSIEHACGGFCACTTCHCVVIEGVDSLEVPDEDELERLSVLDEKTPTSRLGCQAKVKGNVVVRVVNSN